MILAQLTDTHIVRENARYFRIDTARYLRDAVDAVHALADRPDLVMVTGDLVNFGLPEEYDRFVATIARLRIPYLVIPGNHDDRDRLRERLPRDAYGSSTESRIRYARDVRGVRLIGLDGTGTVRFPRPSLDRASLDWLDETLAARPETPTIVCVHQPPFRTGLHYLDVFGYEGLRRFERMVATYPSVGLVISGHVHCVRTARIGAAVAISAPSTAPQIVPELFERRAFGMRRETPGFAVHRWDGRTFATTIHRRDEQGTYVPQPAGGGDEGAKGRR